MKGVEGKRRNNQNWKESKKRGETVELVGRKRGETGGKEEKSKC
jgi:hypothetical protein